MILIGLFTIGFCVAFLASYRVTTWTGVGLFCLCLIVSSVFAMEGITSVEYGPLAIQTTISKFSNGVSTVFAIMSAVVGVGVIMIPYVAGSIAGRWMQAKQRVET